MPQPENTVKFESPRSPKPKPPHQEPKFVKAQYARKVSIYEAIVIDEDDQKEVLEDYAITPITIPTARMKEFQSIKTRMFFEVEVVQVTSPSRFIFNFNKNELNCLMSLLK